MVQKKHRERIVRFAENAEKDLACCLKDMGTLIDEQTIEQASSGWMDNGASHVGECRDAVSVTKRLRIDAFDVGKKGLTAVAAKRRTDTPQQRAAGDNKGVGILLMSRIGEFQRTKALPVLDAYRYSMLLASVPDKNILRRNIHKDEIYIAVAKQLDAIHALIGQDKKLIVSMSRKCYDRLITSAYAKNLGEGYIRQGKLDLYCYSIGNDVILPVPSFRMMTSYNGFDETGLDLASDAKQINWIIAPQHAMVGGSRTDITLKKTPADNEFAEAYDFDYVKTFTFGIREGMKQAVFACVSE